MNSASINRNISQCLWVDLGQTDYRRALDLQLQIVNRKIKDRAWPDMVLSLEHTPVFTLGRRGGKENLTVSESFLDQKGINIIPTDRGGNITFHGPGQLVVYPIIDLRMRGFKVVDFVCGMEKVMVKTAGQWGISAAGDRVNRGVWIGGAKLGSIGITVRRGISFHGMALNINTDLTPFSWINPCGFDNIVMTSLKKECSRTIPMEKAREAVFQNFSDIFQIDMVKEPESCLEKRFSG